MQSKLQQALDSTFVQYKVNGASVAVFIPGKGIWTGVSGISHPDVPIMPESVFGIGSVTKTFTAVIVLQLVEEGKLRLDDSLNRWLPNFPNIDSLITIGQLLNHTSGVFCFTMHPDFDSLLQTDLYRFWTPEETIMTFVSTPYCFPGGGYNYSNTNYCQLGMIIKYGARMVFIPSAGASIVVLVNDGNGYECKAAISRVLTRVILDNN